MAANKGLYRCVSSAIVFMAGCILSLMFLECLGCLSHFGVFFFNTVCFHCYLKPYFCFSRRIICVHAIFSHSSTRFFKRITIIGCHMCKSYNSALEMLNIFYFVLSSITPVIVESEIFIKDYTFMSL